jgi:DeoR/GlpR family transcriptional regulator of sugar metabolism
MFDVSETTVRRDLQQLAQQGLLQKTYGGAMVADSNRAWNAVEVRDDPFTSWSLTMAYHLRRSKLSRKNE